jgi:hypothetical protein
MCLGLPSGLCLLDYPPLYALLFCPVPAACSTPLIPFLFRHNILFRRTNHESPSLMPYVTFHGRQFSLWGVVRADQIPKLEDHPCHLFTIAYSVYLQVPSISEVCLHCPQLVDILYHSDRDPLNMNSFYVSQQ